MNAIAKTEAAASFARLSNSIILNPLFEVKIS